MEMNEIIAEIHDGFKTIPVPLDEIAKNRDIRIEHEMLLNNNAGSIAYYNNQCVIQVNIFDNYRRQRFTIAHELGHYFLHNGDISRNKEAYPKETEEFSLDTLTENRMWRSGLELGKEVEANRFAAELLMPLNMISILISKKGYKKISQLADIFKVSEQALAMRLGIPIE